VVVNIFTRILTVPSLVLLFMMPTKLHRNNSPHEQTESDHSSKILVVQGIVLEGQDSIHLLEKNHDTARVALSEVSSKSEIVA
jgi:hypothetical protein